MLEDAKSTHDRAITGIAALQSQMTFRFSVLSKLLDTQMNQIAATVGLGLLEYRAMAVMGAFSAITAADIVRYTAYDKAAVSRAVRMLIDEGLVSSAQDPDHGRRILLSLTDAGKARIAALEPAVLDRRDQLAEILTPDEQVVFLSSIEKLAAHLDRQMRSPKGD